MSLIPGTERDFPWIAVIAELISIGSSARATAGAGVTTTTGTAGADFEPARGAD